MAANYRKFRRIISIGAVSLVMALFAIPLVSATEALSIGDADREQRIAWHRAARYGAMVHFSPDTIGKLYHYDGAEVGDPYRGRPIP
ncbi:MAG: hypothetical protein OIF34_07620, partial [Porticoccaceae bacterium]|nr:hypothetical protein [Porticoccaceae bacterium]